MLASINPLGERARNRRWGVTVAAYLIGSVVAAAAARRPPGRGRAPGSATRCPARASPAPRWSPPSAPLALAVDLGLGGLRLPTVHRQVNKDWLDRYRGWVVGAGLRRPARPGRGHHRQHRRRLPGAGAGPAHRVGGRRRRSSAPPSAWSGPWSSWSWPGCAGPTSCASLTAGCSAWRPRPNASASPSRRCRPGRLSGAVRHRRMRSPSCRS